MSQIEHMLCCPFTDVVIGAPYEDEGKGAIYIYRGNRHGIASNYSQVKLSFTIIQTNFDSSANISIRIVLYSPVWLWL